MAAPQNKGIFLSRSLLFAVLAVLSLEILIGLANVVLPPLVYLCAVLIPFVLLVCAVKPEVCYYGFILVLPFWDLSLYRAGFIDIRPADLMLICLLFMLFVGISRNRNIRIEGTVLAVPIVLLGMWLTLSLWWGSISFGVTLLTHFCYGIAVYFVTVNVIKSEPLARSAINVWIMSGLLAGLIGCIEFCNAPLATFERIGQIRSAAFFGSENMLGNFLSVCILLTFGRVVAERNPWKKLMLIVFVGIMLGGLLSTFSRTAFTGLICGCIFFAAFCREARKPMLSFLIFLGLVLFLTRGDLLKLFFERYLVTFSQGVGEVSPRRVASWKEAWRLFVSSPLIGVGYGNYTQIVGEAGNKALRHIHGVHMAVLAELGLVGFFLFLHMIIRLALYVKKTLGFIKKTPSLFQLSLAVVSGLIVYLVCSFTQAIYLHNRNMWAFIGLAMAVMVNCKGAVRKAKMLEEPACKPMETVTQEKSWCIRKS